MTYQFGTGTLIGTPVGGNMGANPTPMQFGTLQGVELDISFTNKELYGQKQLPVYSARGQGKVTGKATLASIFGKFFSDLFFGVTPTTGQTLVAVDEAGTVPAATPWNITVANSSKFSADLGVRYANGGAPLTAVPSAPTQGEYSVAAGVYTFSTADANTPVLITYEYTSTTGLATLVTNQALGYAPVFQIVLAQSLADQGGVVRQSNVKLFACTGTKLTRSTKTENFTIPDFEFQGFADASGNIALFWDNQ